MDIGIADKDELDRYEQEVRERQEQINQRRQELGLQALRNNVATKICRMVNALAKEDVLTVQADACLSFNNRPAALERVAALIDQPPGSTYTLRPSQDKKKQDTHVSTARDSGIHPAPFTGVTEPEPLLPRLQKSFPNIWQDVEGNIYILCCGICGANHAQRTDGTYFNVQGLRSHYSKSHQGQIDPQVRLDSQVVAKMARKTLLTRKDIEAILAGKVPAGPAFVARRYNKDEDLADAPGNTSADVAGNGTVDSPVGTSNTKTFGGRPNAGYAVDPYSFSSTQFDTWPPPSQFGSSAFPQNCVRPGERRRRPDDDDDEESPKVKMEIDSDEDMA